MSGYEVGDYVLVRAKVVEVLGRERGYAVELFSKTDQYSAAVLADLVVSKTLPPRQEEPGHDCLAIDQVGDVWRWSVRQVAWECVRQPSLHLAWDTVASSWGPLAIYEATS